MVQVSDGPCEKHMVYSWLPAACCGFSTPCRVTCPAQYQRYHAVRVLRSAVSRTLQFVCAVAGFIASSSPAERIHSVRCMHQCYPAGLGSPR